MEQLKLNASPYVEQAFIYWKTHKNVHGHTFFFSWLHQTQGVAKIQGLTNPRKPRRTDTLEFVDEQAMLLFILRWTR